MLIIAKRLNLQSTRMPHFKTFGRQCSSGMALMSSNVAFIRLWPYLLSSLFLYKKTLLYLPPS